MAALLGFPVLPSGGPQLGTYLVPGTSVKLTVARDVAPILIAVARDFDREVEDLIPGQCGGFNPRRIAGSASWSRHAAGLAIDLNWQKHPMGKRGTFTAAKQAAIKKICARYKVVRWGGTYVSRPDDMHLEINAQRPAVLAAVKALQTPPKPATPTAIKPGTRLLKQGASGADVAFVQRWVGATADGTFGSATTERVKRYQRIVGLTADGQVGAKTWSKMLGHAVRL
jgi:hypothetical protein